MRRFTDQYRWRQAEPMGPLYIDRRNMREICIANAEWLRNVVPPAILDQWHASVSGQAWVVADGRYLRQRGRMDFRSPW